MSGPYGVHLRETPPLDHTVDVEVPGGAHYRWGWDDPNPKNVPEQMSFGSAMPGGYERFSCVLQRDPRINYPDLVAGSKLTVYCLGGSTIVFQGRVEKLPDVSGSQAQVTVEASGYQAALEDDESAREIYVDSELGKWEGPTNTRKIARLEAGESLTAAAVAGAPNGLPALVTALTGPLSSTSAVEGWYDGKGIAIGELAYAYKCGATVGESATWHIYAELTPTETGGGSGAAAHEYTSETQEAVDTLEPAAASPWAYVRTIYTGGEGAQNTEYPVYWAVLVAYGTHGLELQGSVTAEKAAGLLASDIIGHALSHWAPEISYSTGREGSILPTSYAITQSVFSEPTTVANIVKESTKYELEDWAVWDGPTFYLEKQSESRGKAWVSRSGICKLEQSGEEMARQFDGVVVSWTDTAGTEHTVGPPGCLNIEATSSLLAYEPEGGVLTEAKISRWHHLQAGAGVATQADAETVGAIYLAEVAQLSLAGTATLTGFAEAANGTLWPASMVRAGDTLSVVDSRDPSPRKISKVEYGDSTKAATLQLGGPPEGALDAVLERLGANALND